MVGKATAKAGKLHIQPGDCSFCKCIFLLNEWLQVQIKIDDDDDDDGFYYHCFNPSTPKPSCGNRIYTRGF